MYQYTSRQKLPITMEKAWEFLSDPKNLKRITPDYMGFDILSGADRSMFPGQIIQYRLTPILNIPFRWVTEITHVKDMEYFVDEQRVGPYTLWHHQHFLEEKENGTLMTDIVSYAPPFGVLGSIANTILIKHKLKEIFDYREKTIIKMFG